MIPFRSRSDSLTFTPRLSAIDSENNFSRFPYFIFSFYRLHAIIPLLIRPFYFQFGTKSTDTGLLFEIAAMDRNKQDRALATG
jgi:hypothetical protein